MVKKYTQQELEYIMNNYKTKSNLEIGEELGLSRDAIRKMLKRRGIHRTKEEIKNNYNNNKHLCEHYGEEHSLFGKPRTAEVKEKISKKLTYKTIPYIKKSIHITKEIAEKANSTKGKTMILSHFIWCNQPENLPYIPEGFLIHHLDLNPENNSPENLLLLPETYHLQLHQKISTMIRSTL